MNRTSGSDPHAPAPPAMDLTGKVALVTGGSRGIGRATARLLGACGASIGIGYRTRSEEAEALVEELGRNGVHAVAVAADLSREEGAAELFDRTEAALGAVDLFVGNHGVWRPDDIPLARMSTEQWRRTLGINLDSIFFTTREAARRLADGGSIVLVTSTAAQRGEAFHVDYAASKGAIVSFVKGLCVELAPRGITVNSVAPGWVDTEMIASALDVGGRERIEQTIPLGRVASADDVAGPIVFLLTSLARHITGEVLNVNGGSVLAG